MFIVTVFQHLFANVFICHVCTYASAYYTLKFTIIHVDLNVKKSVATSLTELCQVHSISILHTGNSRPDIGRHSMNVVHGLNGVWGCMTQVANNHCIMQYI